MKINKNDMIQLSAYLDGELKPGELKQLEAKLKESAELRERLEELDQMRGHIKNAPTADPAPFFEQVLMYKIEQQNGKGSFLNAHKNILTYSGIAASILILIVLLVFSNINDKNDRSNFAALSGFSPVPSSSSISNEDVFNFALYNRLPFNDKKSQFIELGNDETGDEYIAIRAYDKAISINSLRNYYMAMGLNDEQIRQFDSILGIYADMIRQKALFQKENKLALNTNLWNINSALTTDLVLFSVNANEDQFERFVPTYNDNAGSIDMVRNAVQVNDDFLVLTIDTLIIRPFEINISVVNSGIDTIEKSMAHLKKHLKRSLVALNDSLINSGKNEMVFQKNFTITNDSDYIYIKFLTSNNIEFENEMDAESLRDQLKDLRKQMKFMNIELNIDSAMFLVDSNTNSLKVPFYTLNIDSINIPKVDDSHVPKTRVRKDTQAIEKNQPGDIKKGMPQAMRSS